MTDFYFSVFLPDAEQGGYTVLFPNFKECVAEGDTLEECMRNAGESLADVLQNYVDTGRPLPENCTYEEALAFAADVCARDGSSAEGALVQLIASPNFDRTPVRLSVSMPRCAVAALDRKAKMAGMTRSGYIAALAMA